MESYPIINFPIDKAFDEMTPLEAKTNFEWFVRVIPERIKILENAVKADYPDWIADFSRQSLFDLGNWVKVSVRMRKWSDQEKEDMIKERGMTKFQADMIRGMELKLSSGSERIRFDVGIYLGETFRNNIPNLEWQYEKAKSLASKGSPILALKKNSPIKAGPMPVLGITRNIVLRIAEGDSRGDDFVKVYDIWYEGLTKGPNYPPFK